MDHLLFKHGCASWVFSTFVKSFIDIVSELFGYSENAKSSLIHNEVNCSRFRKNMLDLNWVNGWIGLVNLREIKIKKMGYKGTWCELDWNKLV